MKKLTLYLALLALVLCSLSAMAEQAGLGLALPELSIAGADGATAAPSEATYTVYVVDQHGDPVPEAAVGFCVDTGCMPIEADESGVATYTGAPQQFHLKVIDAPDGYDYPDDTDIYIGPASGEQTLVITREE